jgi:uncharacterized membrane protein YjgN (DUF898 family)
MSPKQFEFTGSAGQFFVVTIVSAVTAYIPIFGLPIGFNYTNSWLADNVLINGRKIKYTAQYGETLKFLFINILLVIITLGIYIFWFGPKSYRFIADHVTFLDTTSPISPVTGAPQPIAPAVPPAPVSI